MRRLGVARRMSRARGLTDVQSRALPGTVKPYDLHVLVSAGPSQQWPSKIESTDPFMLRLNEILPTLSAKTKVTGFESPSRDDSERDVYIFPLGKKFEGVALDQVAALLGQAVEGIRDAAPARQVRTGGAFSVEATLDSDLLTILVCIHGSRDERCGKCGGALLQELRTLAAAEGPKVRVLGVSHVGGHEYAANVIIYGGACDGFWFGHLGPEHARSLLDVATGRVDPVLLEPHQRGRASWAPQPDVPVPPTRRQPARSVQLRVQDPSGEVFNVESPPGITLLAVSRLNLDKFAIEGACGGNARCSTCHVILDPAIYEKLEKPSESEDDMLDQLDAEGLRTTTSRLGCQIRVTDALAGSIVRLPSRSVNFQGTEA